MHVLVYSELHMLDRVSLGRYTDPSGRFAVAATIKCSRTDASWTGDCACARGCNCQPLCKPPNHSKLLTSNPLKPQPQHMPTFFFWVLGQQSQHESQAAAGRVKPRKQRSDRVVDGDGTFGAKFVPQASQGRRALRAGQCLLDELSQQLPVVVV